MEPVFDKEEVLYATLQLSDLVEARVSFQSGSAISGQLLTMVLDGL